MEFHETSGGKEVWVWSERPVPGVSLGRHRVSVYRNQVKKKLVLQLWPGNCWRQQGPGGNSVCWQANVYSTGADFKRGAKAREASSGGNSAAKIFFFRVRRKEKTPNQYAEIINVYANESLNQENKKIKGTKWFLMDMCLSMPTDNTPLETNIKSKS